ncbi:MAG TPA: DUF6683 family protein [Pyrinomonadaceae bacterium]
MRKLTLATTALLLFAGARVPARAQYSTAPVPSWHDYGVMRQQTLNQWSTREKLKEYRRRQAANRATPSKGSAGGGGTTFREVAPSIMPRQLAQEMARTAAERQKLERVFSDLLENYRNNLRQSGAPLNDVARAASFLIASSYMVYFDTKPMSDAQYLALRRQMHEVFAGDAQFQRLPDRDKQKMFEGYGITAAWIDIGYQMVKRDGDREGMTQWREMARRNLENMLGASPEQVRFTDAGVEYK